MKEYFEDLKRIGYVRSFRPFSILLFGDLISKFTGAKMELNLDKDASITLRKGWEIQIGEVIKVKGRIEKDFVGIAQACGIAIGILDEKISKEVLNYPLDPKYVWAAYQESKRFGFLWLKNLLNPKYKKFEIVDGKEGEPDYDFPGEFKLGATFVKNYKEGFINKNKNFLRNVLKAISFFFSHRSDFFYGKLIGDIREIVRFRANCLKEAKKGNFVAQRAMTNLINGKIRVTDFQFLNDKFNTNLNLKVEGEKYNFSDLNKSKNDQ